MSNHLKLMLVAVTALFMFNQPVYAHDNRHQRGWDHPENDRYRYRGYHRPYYRAYPNVVYVPSQLYYQAPPQVIYYPQPVYAPPQTSLFWFIR